MAKAIYIDVPLIKYAAGIENVGRKADEIAAAALYEGAKIYAKSFVSELNNALSPASKNGPLVKAFGIAPFKTNSNFDIETHLGFDGYQEVNGKKIPFQMLARIINSGAVINGSQHIPPSGYAKKGISKAKAAAEKAMQEAAERKINELKAGV